ncbi:MAG: NADH-quinone oxidoreductase subunit NuoH [Chloroflexota bacterium]
MDWYLLLEWIIKAALMLLVFTGGFAYVTWFERRLLARIQVRVGPNRAGPFGLLQPVADGIKLIFKEELIPANAERLIFVLAPVITVIPALVITAVVPWGTHVTLFGREIALHMADLNVGMLYILAVASISVYGITLAGWASNNKYALLGGLRASAQMISYELALGLSLVPAIMLSSSMSLVKFVETQQQLGLIAWWLFQPFGMFIFFIASVAEINRAPFDMPEAEQELTAGYHVEYSGMKFALFFMAEYIKMIAVSMIGATVFFGGYWGPFVDELPVLGPVYLFLKVVILLFGFVWLRATSPRIRYDRLMAFGWKILLPASLVNVAITAIAMVLAGQVV